MPSALTRLSTVRVRTVIACDRDPHATHRATGLSAAGQGQRGEVAGDAVDVGVLDVAEDDDLDVVVGQVRRSRGSPGAGPGGSGRCPSAGRRSQPKPYALDGESRQPPEGTAPVGERLLDGGGGATMFAPNDRSHRARSSTLEKTPVAAFASEPLMGGAGVPSVR